MPQINANSSSELSDEPEFGRPGQAAANAPAPTASGVPTDQRPAGGDASVDSALTVLDRPAILAEALCKVFCSDLWASSRYALLDLLSPAALFRRGAGRRPLRSHEFYALRDVNFRIGRGETVAVLGLRRSGKSTLANVIGGLYPPDRGRIAVAGQQVLVNAVGAGMRPMLTLRENARFRAALYGADRSWLKECTDEVLAFAGLTDQAERLMFNVDPLDIKRLGLAIALHLNADTFIFDDSLSLRDPLIRDRAMRRLGSLLNGRTAMIFSRDRELLWTHAPRGLVLDQGRIVFDGPIDDAITTFDELLLAERASGNGESTVSDVDAMLDDDGGDDEIAADADMAQELEGVRRVAISEPAEPVDKASRRPRLSGPSLHLRHISLNGLKVDPSRQFWFTLRPGEDITIRGELLTLRDVHFDTAWIGLHLPYVLTPIGSAPLKIDGLSVVESEGCEALIENQTITLEGQLTVPHLAPGVYGLTMQWSRGGRPPSKHETLKLLIFGITGTAPAGKGVALCWSGTAAASLDSREPTKSVSTDADDHVPASDGKSARQ